MHPPKEPQWLPAIKEQITTFDPTRQMFWRQGFIQCPAGIMTSDLGDLCTDKPPALSRRIHGDPLKNNDVTEEVLEVAGRYVGPGGHEARAGLISPERQELFINWIAEREPRIAEVMPLLLCSFLIERTCDRDNVHAPILDWKYK
jgi:hypothetical protein